MLICLLLLICSVSDFHSILPREKEPEKKKCQNFKGQIEYTYVFAESLKMLNENTNTQMRGIDAQKLCLVCRQKTHGRSAQKCRRTYGESRDNGKGNKEKEENEVFKSCMQKKKKRKEGKKKVKRQIKTPL